MDLRGGEPLTVCSKHEGCRVVYEGRRCPFCDALEQAQEVKDATTELVSDMRGIAAQISELEGLRESL